MNEELFELLAAANAAHRDGVPVEQINASIQRRTGGRFGDAQSLAAAVQQAAAEERQAQQATAQARLAERGGSAFGDFARMAAQGLTFGFADELAGLGAAIVPGGRGYREAVEASRQRVEDLRELNPMAATLSEVAGGAALPVGAFLGIGGRAAVASGRLGGAAARGAATGAATGALTGLGEAEGTLAERAPEAGLGGLFGGVVGGGLGGASGALGTVTRAFRGRTPRTAQEIADALAKEAGVPGGQIGRMQDVAKETVKRVRSAFYQPLEEAFQEVDDEAILRFLRPRTGGGEVARAVQWATRQVMGRDIQKRPPSFRELQSILRRLRGRASKAGQAGDPAEAQQFRQAAGELRALMERRIPGFAEAQAEYSRALAAKNAFDRGTKLWGAGSKRNRPEQIRQALAALPDDVARANARAGMAAAFYDELSRRGGRITKAQIEKLQAAGWQARLRELFPSREAFDRFNAQLEEAGEAILDAEAREAARATLRNWARIGIGVGIGAAGVTGVRSLFD